jgi:hypothetical protein
MKINILGIDADIDVVCGNHSDQNNSSSVLFEGGLKKIDTNSHAVPMNKIFESLGALSQENQ